MKVFIMQSIQHVLTALSPQLLMDIQASYYSIFKINKEDQSYKNLCEDYTNLEGASYIINPNFNDAEGSIFIDPYGKLILKANFFSNLITHLPLDFEYETTQYIHNHPFEKIFAQLKF